MYGKKGSMRHFVTKRWGALVGLVGVAWASASAIICGSIMLAPGVYGIYRGVKSVVDVYRERIQVVDEWVADEKVEGLLEDDRYLEDLEDEEVPETKTDEKTSFEKSHTPPPPYIGVPMEAEKTSTSVTS